MKPSFRDIGILVGLQLGYGVAAAIVVEILPFRSGSQSWIGGVACMAGAMTFAMMREKKLPGAFDVDLRHGLALFAVAAQLVLAALFVGVVAPEVLELSTPLLIGVVAIAGLATYAMTRLGFRLGLQAVERGRQAEKKD